MAAEARLTRRIRRDFPEPGSANGILRLLADSPSVRGSEPEGTERIQAAIVILAAGDLTRLRAALAVVEADWRDLLVAAGLAHNDWRARLDQELGTADT
ncbi:hypothetical protein ACQPYE_27850 [Actinosynnema sp. CA-299493]